MEAYPEFTDWVMICVHSSGCNLRTWTRSACNVLHECRTQERYIWEHLDGDRWWKLGGIVWERREGWSGGEIVVNGRCCGLWRWWQSEGGGGGVGRQWGGAEVRMRQGVGRRGLAWPALAWRPHATRRVIGMWRWDAGEPETIPRTGRQVSRSPTKDPQSLAGSHTAASPHQGERFHQGVDQERISTELGIGRERKQGTNSSRRTC